MTDHILTGNRPARFASSPVVELPRCNFSPRDEVLTAAQVRNTRDDVTADSCVLSDLLAEISLRQLPDGGWAALASSSQPSLEATCYSTLALGLMTGSRIQRAQDFLLRSQNPNGSWPAFEGDEQSGSWVTAIAVIALGDLVPAIAARLKAFHWLLDCSGREGNWFWKWKFRIADRHVQFDPGKFGWPWFPDTVSWVVPTAFAVLALKQLPCGCEGFEKLSERMELGIEMLIDRACPQGGWNAGNGVVYGSQVAPHPDDTATALLALTDQRQDPVVQSGLQYLQRVAPTLAAPWSLAWAALALAAYGCPVASLHRLLVALPDLSKNLDTGTLALVCLALAPEWGLSALGAKS